MRYVLIILFALLTLALSAEPPKTMIPPHCAALSLVFPTREQKPDHFDSPRENWWFDAKARERSVQPPFSPGYVDSRYMFTVIYKIGRDVVVEWSANTDSTTVIERRLPQKRQEDVAGKSLHSMPEQHPLAPSPERSAQRTIHRLYYTIALWLVGVPVIGIAVFRWTTAPLMAEGTLDITVSILARSAFLALVFAPYGVAGGIAVAIAPASLFAVYYALGNLPNRMSDLISCAQVFAIVWGIFAGLYGVRLKIRSLATPVEPVQTSHYGTTAINGLVLRATADSRSYRPGELAALTRILTIGTLVPAPAVWIAEHITYFPLVRVTTIPLALILAGVAFAKAKEDKNTRMLATISLALNLSAVLLMVTGTIISAH